MIAGLHKITAWVKGAGHVNYCLREAGEEVSKDCTRQMMPKENSKKILVKSPPWVLAACVGADPAILNERTNERTNEMMAGLSVSHRMLSQPWLGLSPGMDFFALAGCI